MCRRQTLATVIARSAQRDEAISATDRATAIWRNEPKEGAAHVLAKRTRGTMETDLAKRTRDHRAQDDARQRLEHFPPNLRGTSRLSCPGIAVRRTASLRSPMTRASMRPHGETQPYRLHLR